MRCCVGNQKQNEKRKTKHEIKQKTIHKIQLMYNTIEQNHKNKIIIKNNHFIFTIQYTFRFVILALCITHPYSSPINHYKSSVQHTYYICKQRKMCKDPIHLDCKTDKNRSNLTVIFCCNHDIMFHFVITDNIIDKWWVNNHNEVVTNEF